MINADLRVCLCFPSFLSPLQTDGPLIRAGFCPRFLPAKSPFCLPHRLFDAFAYSGYCGDRGLGTTRRKWAATWLKIAVIIFGERSVPSRGTREYCERNKPHIVSESMKAAHGCINLVLIVECRHLHPASAATRWSTCASPQHKPACGTRAAVGHLRTSLTAAMRQMRQHWFPIQTILTRS